MTGGTTPSSVGTPVIREIHVRRLSLRRDGRELFRDFSCTIPAGSFLSVLGPSGCGKTSFLGLLAGLFAPTSGEVLYRIGESEFQAPGACRQQMAMVFQHLRLTANASALTNVLCGLLGKKRWWETLGGFTSEEKLRGTRLLDSLGLANFAHAPTGRLSGGEKQRVAIARALIRTPSVLLADEPVSHLDPALCRQTIAALREGSKLHRQTTICVLHDRSLAEEFSDALILSPSDADRAQWTLEWKTT